MRDVTRKLLAAAILAGSSVLALSTAAQAHDDERWEWRHRHYEHWRHYEPAPRVVYERPRPVYVAPAPVYAMPMYSAPAPQPSSLNLNFNIPLQ